MQVSFPKLGLEFTIERIAFHLFSLPIYWYGIIIAFGLVAGILVSTLSAKKLGDNTDIPIDLAIFCGPVSIVCARLYYVIFNFSYYFQNPIEIFNLRQGGIAIYGAVIGAVLSAYVYSRVKKYNSLRVFDIGSFGLITGQMIGRWGNFFNQEAFGDNTNLPWGMISQNTVSHLNSLQSKGFDVDPLACVHPTFLYESVWCLGVLILMFVVFKKYRYNGQIFFLYAFLYGLGRFWIEGLRTDSLMLGSIRVSQALALISVFVFGFLYIYFLKKHRTNDAINN